MYIISDACVYMYIYTHTHIQEQARLEENLQNQFGRMVNHSVSTNYKVNPDCFPL